MAQSYKIPQNVDLEDKIFGPFTLKQFIYLLAAGMAIFVSFSMFYTVYPPAFFVSAFIVCVVAGAFVFVKPNEQPFSKYAYSALNFVTKPQRRVWKRIPTLGQVQLHEQRPEVAPVADEPSLDEVRGRLARLAHIVDTRGWSDVDTDASDVAERVTGGEAKPAYNVSMTQSEEDELAADDVLAHEDNEAGPSRATSELDQLLKTGVERPNLPRATRIKEAARHAEQGA